MATAPLAPEESDWKSLLETAGFRLSGVVLADVAFMQAVFRVLGIGEHDFAKQSRVRSFIQKQQQQETLPPRTPTRREQRQFQAPASAGNSSPKQSNPRKAPSSDEGKAEGLCYASNDRLLQSVHCSSHPACVQLLQIFENAHKDVLENKMDKKFIQASRHVIEARHRLSRGKLPADIGANERFFTGAMANALNAVLDSGFIVLHQACLGTGATHSDLSACRILEGWPKTLMVGEGKWNAGKLREDTRGQILNELLRHRAIDKSDEYSPILLLAFDSKKIEIDLAFPSTKGGKLAQDGVVEFSENISHNSETFWTVRLVRISIEDGNGTTNLPTVFRFISESLKVLYEWPQKTRVQFKMPIPLSIAEESKIASVATFGDNVTIVESKKEGSARVYKEFCYHLREASDILAPLLIIDKKNQRQPPPDELIKALGPPYTDWTVCRGPFGISVLCYDFIEGSPNNPSVKGWSMILKQVYAMHSINFVHGDLLPRNVLFGAIDQGYVIDFDLSRKEGEHYVQGFNYKDFKKFRHKDAKELMPMKKEHDLHSLRQMSEHFFDLGSYKIDALTLEKLIEFFQDNVDLAPNSGFMGDESATGSPLRKSY